MPRRQVSYKVRGLRPWSGVRPETLGQSPNQGPSPTVRVEVNGEAQPRLTSGGKAGATSQKDLPLKPRRLNAEESRKGWLSRRSYKVIRYLYGGQS